MLDLRAQHAELEEELLEGFSAVIASGRFVLGEPVEAFESSLAKLCDLPHAISCNSGTDALWLALRGLGVGVGDSVLCPAYSFFATAAAIVRVGARPVFADIQPSSFNLDPEDAIRRAEQTENLRAVISVDLFGRICELGPLETYCRDRGIPIIQDAAQSIGALDATARKVGSRASVACDRQSDAGTKDLPATRPWGIRTRRLQRNRHQLPTRCVASSRARRQAATS